MVNMCAVHLSKAACFFRIRTSPRVIPLAVYDLIVHGIEVVRISPDISSVSLAMSSAHAGNMRDIILSLSLLDTVVRFELLHVPGVLNYLSFVHHESRSFRIFSILQTLMKPGAVFKQFMESTPFRVPSKTCCSAGN